MDIDGDGPSRCPAATAAAAALSHRVWSSGVACIAVASAVYSVAAALVRPLSPGIDVFQIVATRSALSLGLSAAAYRGSGQASPFFGSPQNIPLLATRGLVGAAAMDCYYGAIQRLPLGDAVALLFINPALTALLAWVVLGEALSWRGAAGCGAALGGMLLVARPSLLFGGGGGAAAAVVGGGAGEDPAARRAWGVTFGVASAFLAAGAYLSIRLIGKKETPLTVAVWFHIAACVHSSAALLAGWPSPPVWPTPLDWACLAAIALSSFSANVLLNRGFQLEHAAVASGINTSQVAYSYLIGVLVLGEAASWVGVAGAVAIAAGVSVIAVDSRKTAAAAAAAGTEAQHVEMPGRGKDALEEDEGAALLPLPAEPPARH